MLKLFMILLGSRAPGRHVEQHDFFFAVGTSLKELIPLIKQFWPEAKDKIHIDGWREVNFADGYRVRVTAKNEPGAEVTVQKPRLFFVNLGGYLPNRFEEQHYVILTVQDNRAAALRTAKDTLFYKNNTFEGATSHIDDKYGIDVDDLYEIEDILSPGQKQQYAIELTPVEKAVADELHLGYLKLSAIK